MITLGVECAAHSLGLGIVEGDKILSNIHDIYKPVKEGIVPRKAADHHAEVFARLLKENLEKAKVDVREVDLIAFSQGPGLGMCLAAGTAGAKYLAAKYDKPIIGVNHPYAHVKISEYRTGLKQPLVLYLSGGNSQILVEEKGWLRILGETLDIGIGNLFDSFGRSIGLEYAHGSVLEKMAQIGKFVPLPYTVKVMNMVFSGLLTQAEKLIPKHSKEDLVFSLMETAFAMTCEATERALFLTGRKKLILCGGVAQNKRLQDMLKQMCKEDGVKFGVAENEFNRDNGAMIAYAGEILYKKYGTQPLQYWQIIPRYPLGRMKEIYK